MHSGFRRGPLAVLLTGVSLIVLDFFIVNVALPSIQRELGADTTALQWLTAGYALAFGGLLPVAGRLADRWGRRRVFMLGIAMFVLSSAACGFAPTVPVLLGARVLQGASAAVLSPTILALVGDVYTGPQRVRALGLYATVMGVAAASGQLVGGLLIDLSGWRSIFLVNVPIGIAALVAARRVLPAPRTRAARPDALESLLAMGTLVALVLPLVQGREQGWPLWTWLVLGAAGVLAALTGLRGTALRRRGVVPVVDVAPLRHRPVGAGLLGYFLLFTGMASYFLVLSLYLQDGRGLGPPASGAVFTAVALPYMAGSHVAARVLGRLGARGGITAAALTFAAGHVLLLVAAAANVSVPWLVPGLAVGGLGMGVALSGLVGTVLGAVSPAQAGTVSGMSSTLQQVGSALGVALVGIVFFGPYATVPAFEASLLFLITTTVAVAVAARLLPGRPARPGDHPTQIPEVQTSPA